MANGLPVTAMVRSVQQDGSSAPVRWIVSVVLGSVSQPD
jgi:hypothetical protein